MRYRYREITEKLLEEITQGSIPVGEKLPSEEKLTERFLASRNTVRESLRELEIRGYLKRHRGTRALVISNKPKNRFTNSLVSIEELLQYTRFRSSDLDSKLLSENEIARFSDVAKQAGINENITWRQLKVLRTSKEGNVPFGYFEVYVANQFVTAITDFDLSKPVYQILEEKMGRKFSTVKQTISAGVATKEFFRPLKVQLGSPILQARTEFITEEKVIAEVGMAYFPADRYRLEVILERER